ARAILWDRARGHVKMDIASLERFCLDPQPRRVRLDQTDRRLRALLHHVAELAREDEMPLSWHARRLDEEDVAAERRPRHPRRHAREARPQRGLVLELRRAEDPPELVLADPLRTFDLAPFLCD